MKVLEINSVNYGSTGNIMFCLSDLVQERGGDCLCATGFTWHKSKRQDHMLIGNILTKTFHMYGAKAFGNHGLYTVAATKRFIKVIKTFSPDVIHLHNLHGWYLNIPMLFAFLRDSKIPVVWTLHDCWSFTGGCAQFQFCGCQRWKTGCGNCTQLSRYPIASRCDRTAQMWHLKRAWFQKLEHMTIVAPSQWLAALVETSFLQEYPLQVICNGIDLDVFRPTPGNFKEKYNCGDKYVILGVALDWSERKGLDVFCALAEHLDTEKYQLVLVGTNERIERSLPQSILSIRCSYDQRELAEIYTAADVFVNPTREDTYPTVNMEALACGTPVVTFCAGGSPEIVDDSCGAVVEIDNLEKLQQAISRICKEKTLLTENCLKKAEKFDKNKRFQEYLDLYERIIARTDQTGRV